MFSFASLTSFAVLASTVIAAPVNNNRRAPLTVQKYSGETSGRYIVKLKDGIQVASIADNVKSKVTHRFSKVFNGFVVENGDDLDSILSNENVERVEEDGLVHIFETQTDAPWGLSRVSSSDKLDGTDADALDYEYTYDTASGDVDVYVVDTGVNVEHSDFEGRAKWGKAVADYDEEDGNGHGTHCAGTIAGKQFGVAKNANIIAVKVLDDSGSGQVSDIVEGLEFAQTSAEESGNPSVVSMSLGGSASTSLDDAVQSLVDAGVHVAVAAGNEASDAGETSPARVKDAITVGASDITDTMADFSNFGDVVDVFAPGVDITSTWIGSDDATNSISGTSMATPHVAGLIAYLLGTGNADASPSEIAELLKSTGQEDKLEGVPSDTANIFINNGA